MSAQVSRLAERIMRMTGHGDGSHCKDISLYRIVAAIAMAKDGHVTASDVHAAWCAWSLNRGQESTLGDHDRVDGADGLSPQFCDETAAAARNAYDQCTSLARRRFVLESIKEITESIKRTCKDSQEVIIPDQCPEIPSGVFDVLGSLGIIEQVQNSHHHPCYRWIGQGAGI